MSDRGPDHKLLRGLKANLDKQPITNGNIYFCKDTGEMYIDIDDQRSLVTNDFDFGDEDE
jgi:hypothetical protein